MPWKHATSDFNGGGNVGTFDNKELQKINQNDFKVEKVIKRKDDKLYVKWRGYENSFKSWTYKKDII